MTSFGIALTTALPPGQTQPQVLQAAVDYAREAEVLGFDSAWVLEHHFTRYGICPSSVTMASYLLGHTTRLKAGTAITVAPLEHPVRLAEQTALLDQLSGGRFELGIGRGIGRKDYEVFHADPAVNHELMQDWVDIMLEGWTADSVEGTSRHMTFPRVPVYPSPFTDPHPPLYIAAESPSTTEWAARLGLPMLLAHFLPREAILSQLDLYRMVAEEHGHDPDRIGHIHTAVGFVADSREEAQRVVTPGLAWWAEVGEQATWTLEQLRKLENRQWYFRRWEDAVLAGRDTEKNVVRVLNQNPVGSAQDCIECLQELIDATGVDRVVCGFEGAMDPARTHETMQRFAAEVMPAFAPKEAELEVAIP